MKNNKNNLDERQEQTFPDKIAGSIATGIAYAIIIFAACFAAAPVYGARSGFPPDFCRLAARNAGKKPVGMAIIIAAAVFYIFYVNPRFMKRKLTKFL